MRRTGKAESVSNLTTDFTFKTDNDLTRIHKSILNRSKTKLIENTRVRPMTKRRFRPPIRERTRGRYHRSIWIRTRFYSATPRAIARRTGWNGYDTFSHSRIRFHERTSRANGIRMPLTPILVNTERPVQRGSRCQYTCSYSSE